MKNSIAIGVLLLLMLSGCSEESRDTNDPSIVNMNDSGENTVIDKVSQIESFTMSVSESQGLTIGDIDLADSGLRISFFLYSYEQKIALVEVQKWNGASALYIGDSQDLEVFGLPALEFPPTVDKLGFSLDKQTEIVFEDAEERGMIYRIVIHSDYREQVLENISLL